jgi:uncharacterized protein
MRIDFHVHPLEPRNLEDSRPLFRMLNANRFEKWMDSQTLSAEGLIADMDRAGVDRAVILAVEYDMDAPLLRVRNERVIELVKMFPDRFIGFASVCPTEFVHGEYQVTERRVQECVRRLKTYVDAGLRGLKILQPFQCFYPNDPRVFPIYAEAERLGIPVIIHTGGEDFPGKIKYCNPVFIDDIAKIFTNLKIVMAHMGSFPFGVWFREAMVVADENPNVYVDLAALRPRELIEEGLLEKAVRWIGSEKIIFGSDWPAVINYPIHQAIQTVLDAPISQEAKDNILGGNASRLLGLNNISDGNKE